MEGTELSRNSREPSRTNWNERSNRRPKREGEGEEQTCRRFTEGATINSRGKWIEPSFRD